MSADKLTPEAITAALKGEYKAESRGIWVHQKYRHMRIVQDNGGDLRLMIDVARTVPLCLAGEAAAALGLLPDAPLSTAQLKRVGAVMQEALTPLFDEWAKVHVIEAINRGLRRLQGSAPPAAQTDDAPLSPSQLERVREEVRRTLETEEWTVYEGCECGISEQHAKDIANGIASRLQAPPPKGSAGVRQVTYEEWMEARARRLQGSGQQGGEQRE